MPTDAFQLRQGDQPLLISIPHAGTHLPQALRERLTPQALAVPDTDWHLGRLYGFAAGLGASVLEATHSRYYIDLNRPPDDQNLYPGQDTTGLCPHDTFDKEPLYLDGSRPSPAEVEARRRAVWEPYHQALRSELARLRAKHGRVVLWEAHSIRSRVPRFFDGQLADLNFGTADGASCDPALTGRVVGVAREASAYSTVLNGRFKGGYNTRHYGNPGGGVHAMQLEMTWSTYMEETPPFRYAPELAAKIEPHLRGMLLAALDWAAG